MQCQFKKTKNSNNINHHNHIFDHKKKKSSTFLGDMIQEKSSEMNSFHITIIEQHNLIYSVFLI